jgi:hypothetical protein
MGFYPQFGPSAAHVQEDLPAAPGRLRRSSFVVRPQAWEMGTQMTQMRADAADPEEMFGDLANTLGLRLWTFVLGRSSSPATS